MTTTKGGRPVTVSLDISVGPPASAPQVPGEPVVVGGHDARVAGLPDCVW